MLVFRSFIFNIIFYIVSFLQLFIYSPVFFLLPHKKAIKVPKLWSRVTLIIQRFMVGTGYEIEGLENLPKDQPYIIAAKHQSSWETFALLPSLDDPALILKRELMWIPFFGWYMWKVGMIPINRGAPLKALKTVIRSAKQKTSEGRQILIFPEGTRRQPGAFPDYKSGIVSLYKELKIPVVIIAHNAGLYWPRGNFRRYPGTIKVRVLPPIAPGLEKDKFLTLLIEEMEKACDMLIIDAAKSKNPPDMPIEAVKRLEAYGIKWQGKIRS